MAAKVGLLSHNIVVQGNDYPSLATDAFGARILVSRMTHDGVDYEGKLAQNGSKLFILPSFCGDVTFKTNLFDYLHDYSFHPLAAITW